MFDVRLPLSPKPETSVAFHFLTLSATFRPMNTITEAAREVPVVHDADVVVVGGSCTGVFAAVRAARLGARVAVIEKQNCFGGVATAGLVNVWHSLHDTEGKKAVIGGLTAEVLERLRKRGAVSEAVDPCNRFRLNTEEPPVLEDEKLAAVIVENKNGRQAIRARQFVDASGDADLALGLGLPSYEPENLQPPTMCAKIAGFEAETMQGFDWPGAIREHGREFGLKRDWGWGGTIPGLRGIHMRADTHVFGTDTSDGDRLTRAEIEGRRHIRAILDLMRKYGPADADLGLVDLAATIGARESRRIVARYRLTGEDILRGRRFEDAIANGSYPVDIHHADGPGITFRYLDGTERVIEERGLPAREGRWRDPLPEDPTFHQVPFRCLVQDRVPNLVLAGRMLDADKAAFSAVRVMVIMNQTGEAAGAACALAVQSDQPVRDVDARRLRETLAAGGSVIL
jgi:hypothetical protein